MKYSKALLFSVSLLILLVGGGGFLHFYSSEANGKEQPQEPAAVTVSTITVNKKPVRIWKQFSGRMAAVDYAEIRPQVGGTITQVLFTDGQEVKKDDVLFVIDPRPYKALVKQREAEVENIKTQLKFIEKDYKRNKSLSGTKAISSRMLEESLSEYKRAEAALEAAEAALEQAQIDYDYAFVKAPFDGKVSRAEITEGNLVQAGINAPVLTSIVSSSGIYADFEVDEQTYLQTLGGNH